MCQIPEVNSILSYFSMIYNSILNLYNPIQGPNTYLMCPGMYSGYTRVLYEGHGVVTLKSGAIISTTWTSLTPVMKGKITEEV